ncbi:tetratricopeptide repeat protein [Candidatus Acetothermia bacterium]|nr:tetratricopeptide repeat protein [Candidatus Acetothermia bacterium]
MPRLEVRLLGEIEISLDGHLLTFPTQKVKELFAYLVTYHTHTHPRAVLAGLLWGDSEEEKAKINLRKTLSLLRKLLDSQADQRPWLDSSGGALRFNPKAGEFWFDVTEFERSIAEGTKAKNPEILERALALYRGPFLRGIYSDWALLETERLQLLYLDALEQLAELYQAQHEHAKALHAWKKTLHAVPWHERAHRELMTLYALAGDRAAALSQYNDYVEVLQTELKATPLPEMRALYERLKQGRPIEPVKVMELPADLPFVGRERERATLKTLWQNVLQGQGQTVLIEGEVGVGKTSFVQHFITQIERPLPQPGSEVTKEAEGGERVYVLYGSCHALGGELPYQPLLQAIREGLRGVSNEILEAIPALWRSELIQFIPELHEQFPELKANPELPLAQGKTRFFSALTGFFESFARERPLVFFLDDLQWADPATLEYLSSLVTQLKKLPILLLGTYRAEEALENTPLRAWLDALGPGRSYQPITLSRLSRDEIERLLEGWLGAGAGQAIPLLHSETEGNPLFVRELVYSLTQSGWLYQDDGVQWKLTGTEISPMQFPESLRELIHASLRRAPERARGLLGLAAVIRRAFDLAVLQKILRQPEEKLLKSLDGLRRAGLLVEREGHYRFYHEMFRQVVYEELSADHRRLWHRQVGQALEALYPDRLDEWAGELALHFERAGQLAKALNYAEKAAGYAHRTYAYEAALEFYDKVRALAEATKNEQEYIVRVCCDRAQIFNRLGRRVEQEAELRAAAAGALRARDQERLRLRDMWADFYMNTGRYSQALQEAQTMLEEARALSNRDMESRAHLQIGLAHLNLGEYPQAIEHFETAAELFKEMSHMDSLGRTLTNLGIAYWYLGEHSRALDLYQKAYEIALQTSDRLGQGRALTNLGIVHKNLRELRKASQCYEQAHRIWQEIGDRNAESHTLVNLGSLHLMQGEMNQAQEYLTQACALSRQIENPQGLAIALHYLGRLYGEQYEEYGEALRYEDEACALAERVGLKALMIHIFSVSAKFCARLGQQAEALARSERALSLLRGSQGTQDPQLIYWNHYELLKFLGQAGSEPARSALQSAYETLRKQAQAIINPKQRETFLAIPDHQQIVQAWEALPPKS